LPCTLLMFGRIDHIIMDGLHASHRVTRLLTCVGIINFVFKCTGLSVSGIFLD
jgi:hypothetical protein